MQDLYQNIIFFSKAIFLWTHMLWHPLCLISHSCIFSMVCGLMSIFPSWHLLTCDFMLVLETDLFLYIAVLTLKKSHIFNYLTGLLLNLLFSLCITKCLIVLIFGLLNKVCFRWRMSRPESRDFMTLAM